MSDSNTKNPLSDVAFSSLGLEPAIMEGIEAAGFTHCTPIQALTLPPALEGKDVAGQAQTGTGKTAAFLLVIFQRLLQDDVFSTGLDRLLETLLGVGAAFGLVALLHRRAAVDAGRSPGDEAAPKGEA